MESQSLSCISRKGNVYFQRWKGKLSFTESFHKFLAKQENTMYGSLCVCVWFSPLFLFGRVEAARCIISCSSTFQLWVMFPVYTPDESLTSLDCFEGMQCASRLDFSKLCLLSFSRFLKLKTFLLSACWCVQHGKSVCLFVQSRWHRVRQEEQIKDVKHFLHTSLLWEKVSKGEDSGLEGGKERENIFKNNSSWFDPQHIYLLLNIGREK